MTAIASKPIIYLLSVLSEKIFRADCHLYLCYKFMLQMDFSASKETARLQIGPQ